MHYERRALYSSEKRTHTSTKDMIKTLAAWRALERCVMDVMHCSQLTEKNTHKYKRYDQNTGSLACIGEMRYGRHALFTPHRKEHTQVQKT